MRFQNTKLRRNSTERDGLMGSADKKFINNTIAYKLRNKACLQLCKADLTNQSSYINLVCLYGPDWEKSSPIGIMISMHSDNANKQGVSWKCYCGSAELIKILKKDDYLYLQNNYTYIIYVYVTMKGKNEPIMDVIASLSDAEEINEAE